MTIIISNTSRLPIYEQIREQIKAHIISGALPPHTSLPSIRNLAKDLRISVITTKRAYEELERDGFLYTIAGKGCFVSERSPEFIREEKLQKLESHVQAVLDLATPMGLTLEDIFELFHTLGGDK